MRAAIAIGAFVMFVWIGIPTLFVLYGLYVIFAGMYAN